MKTTFIIVVVIINACIGGWSVDTILNWFNKDIPVFVDILIGIFVAEFSVPIAIIGEILRYFGVF